MNVEKKKHDVCSFRDVKPGMCFMEFTEDFSDDNPVFLKLGGCRQSYAEGDEGMGASRRTGSVYLFKYDDPVVIINLKAVIG